MYLQIQKGSTTSAVKAGVFWFIFFELWFLFFLLEWLCISEWCLTGEACNAFSLNGPFWFQWNFTWHLSISVVLYSRNRSRWNSSVKSSLSWKWESWVNLSIVLQACKENASLLTNLMQISPRVKIKHRYQIIH